MPPEPATSSNRIPEEAPHRAHVVAPVRSFAPRYGRRVRIARCHTRHEADRTEGRGLGESVLAGSRRRLGVRVTPRGPSSFARPVGLPRLAVGSARRLSAASFAAARGGRIVERPVGLACGGRVQHALRVRDAIALEVVLLGGLERGRDEGDEADRSDVDEGQSGDVSRGALAQGVERPAATAPRGDDARHAQGERPERDLRRVTAPERRDAHASRGVPEGEHARRQPEPRARRDSDRRVVALVAHDLEPRGAEELGGQEHVPLLPEGERPPRGDVRDLEHHPTPREDHLDDIRRRRYDHRLVGQRRRAEVPRPAPSAVTPKGGFCPAMERATSTWYPFGRCGSRRRQSGSSCPRSSPHAVALSGAVIDGERGRSC